MGSSEADVKSSGARRAWGVALWVLIVLDALMMGVAGWAKFGPAASWWAEQFAGWGYPSGFSRVTGGLELGLAVLMLVPRWASYAAIGLIVVMTGALGTVLMNPGRLGPGAPLMHLAVLAVIVWGRWGRRQASM